MVDWGIYGEICALGLLVPVNHWKLSRLEMQDNWGLRFQEGTFSCSLLLAVCYQVCRDDRRPYHSAFNQVLTLSLRGQSRRLSSSKLAMLVFRGMEYLKGKIKPTERVPGLSGQ